VPRPGFGARSRSAGTMSFTLPSELVKRSGANAPNSDLISDGKHGAEPGCLLGRIGRKSGRRGAMTPRSAVGGPGLIFAYFGSTTLFDEPSGAACMVGGDCPWGLAAVAPPLPVVIGPVQPCGCSCPLLFVIRQHSAASAVQRVGGLLLFGLGLRTPSRCRW
jgi:hypothetical protein